MKIHLLAIFMLCYQWVASQNKVRIFHKTDIGVVSEENVSASPNPVNELLTINGLNSKLTYDLHVKVFDFKGSQVLSQALSMSINSIDFTPYPPGVYFIKYSNTAIPMQRIVKE